MLDCSFVYCDDGAFNPKQGNYAPNSLHPVYERQLFKPILSGEKPHQKNILLDNESTKLIDLGDGIASISFKTKMNVISFTVIKAVGEALDHLKGVDLVRGRGWR